MDSYSNKGHRRLPSVESEREMFSRPKCPPGPVATGSRSRRTDSLQFSHPRPPLTPNSSTMPQIMSNPLPLSAPASPPTPAPSPTPHQRSPSSWRLTPLDDSEDPVLDEARQIFARMNLGAKEEWLRSLVELCDHQTLSLLHQIVSPKLKKDPFKALPNEICFRVSTWVLAKLSNADIH